MAGSQIPSSITILNSLHGFQSVSLTEFDTSALSAIAAGSVVEIAGAFFNFAGDETILLWASVETATTAYIALAPSGTAGSQIATASFTPIAPTWRDDLQGWYASVGSTTRVIGSLYKNSATSQWNKIFLSNLININWTNALNTSMGTGWATGLSSMLGSGWATGFSYIYPLNTASTGSYIIYNCYYQQEISTTNTSYVKLIEIKAPSSGVFTVNFKIRISSSTPTGYGRIYINGSAVGTEQTATTSTASVKTENITIAQGDLVQLYCKHSTGGNSVIVGEYAICSSGYGILYA